MKNKRYTVCVRKEKDLSFVALSVSDIQEFRVVWMYVARWISAAARKTVRSSTDKLMSKRIECSRELDPIRKPRQCHDGMFPAISS